MVTQRQLDELLEGGISGGLYTEYETLEEAIENAKSFVRVVAFGNYSNQKFVMSVDCDISFIDELCSFTQCGYVNASVRPSLNVKHITTGYTVELYETYNLRNLTDTSTFKYYAM